MTKRLSELRVGESGVVTGFTCDCDCVLRMQELGLCIGTDVSVSKIAPLGDPVELQFRSCRYCMRKTDIDAVEVDLCDEHVS